jgi:hypothetical protein
MRGANITNIYIINAKEYLISELNEEQLSYINSVADISRYNELRNKLLFERGKDLKCRIKIIFPEQNMEFYDQFGKLLYISNGEATDLQQDFL